MSIINDEGDCNVLFEGNITGLVNNGICGKRQLRGQTRKDIGAKLYNTGKSVDTFRANYRREIQEHGEAEQGHLWSDRVIRQSQTDYVNSKYFDKDPVEAIKIMKSKFIGRNTNHNIGADPFHVFMFSPHQVRLWNQLGVEHHSCIDFTTGIARKLKMYGNKKSHTLALHLGVINCDYGQLAVFEGITERQDTVTIEQLLKRYIQAGAGYPKQIVSIHA